MSDVSGDGDATASITQPASSYPSLKVSASYKESGGGKSSSKRRPVKLSLDDAAAENEFITQLHGSDPVKVELNRLENEVRGSKKEIKNACSIRRFDSDIFDAWFDLINADKDRELGEAHAEIKALRLSERQREKAVEEVFSSCLIFYFLSLSCLRLKF